MDFLYLYTRYSPACHRSSQSSAPVSVESGCVCHTESGRTPSHRGTQTATSPAGHCDRGKNNTLTKGTGETTLNKEKIYIISIPDNLFAK